MLVHSPLVGPSTMAPLAAMLRTRGWATVVPDLRSAVSAPARFGRAVAEAADSADVVVGHSGAGPFLPAVGGGTTIYVDAVVPPAQPEFRPPPSLVRLLDALAITDGWLPPWNEWWPPQVLVDLVPDAGLRARLAAEVPRVPRSFYDVPVALPPQWWTRPAGYIQLSQAYEDDRRRALGWGWPTGRLLGGHLDVCVRPDAVAEQVVELVDRLQWARPPAEEED